MPICFTLVGCHAEWQSFFAPEFEEANVVGSMLLNDFDIDTLIDHFGLSVVHARHLLREVNYI